MTMTPLFTITFLTMLLLLPTIGSCSSVTPHENFKQHMSRNVGKKIGDPTTKWMNERVLMRSRELPNGQIEYQYRFRGTCRYYFEVDSKTSVIVGWRFEGTEEDCAIVP